MPALHAGDGPMQDSTSCVNRCIYCHMLYQMFDANILYGTHQKKKMTLTFGTFFCGTACAANLRLLLQIGRFLPRIGRFLPKKWKASTEECWVRTHISFRNAVELRLRIFWSCVCVFRDVLAMAK